MRRLRASRNPPTAVRVIFGDGTYKLNQTVNFGPLDSGTQSAPVRFEAAKGARPIFVGGELLHGWSPSTSGSWKTFVTSAAKTDGRFEQLWADGKLCTRARSPNQGYFCLSKATDVNEDHCLPGWFDWLYPRVNNRLNAEHQLTLYEFRQGVTRILDAGKKSFKADPAQLQ
ncbi:MAG TPA: hypothetical protein V6C69_05650, partial [Trichormus sp.]